MTNREQFLDLAKEACTRKDDSDNIEDCFDTIADFWRAYMKHCQYLQARDVANMMILLKMARAVHRYKPGDSYVDIAGYAACASEMLLKRQKR